jgi:hypothetical protein
VYTSDATKYSPEDFLDELLGLLLEHAANNVWSHVVSLVQCREVGELVAERFLNFWPVGVST